MAVLLPQQQAYALPLLLSLLIQAVAVMHASTLWALSLLCRCHHPSQERCTLFPSVSLPPRFSSCLQELECRRPSLLCR